MRKIILEDNVNYYSKMKLIHNICDTKNSFSYYIEGTLGTLFFRSSLCLVCSNVKSKQNINVVYNKTHKL